MATIKNKFEYLLYKRTLLAGLLTVVSVVVIGFGAGIAFGVIDVPFAAACCGVPIPPPPPPPPPPVPPPTTPPPVPQCTLSASPTSVDSGNSSTLSWTTTNATDFSINQGIGSEASVAAGSASTGELTATTTFTGTATGPGGSVTCSATVKVVLPPPPSPPTCTLSANPTSIASGSSSTLSWATTNASSFTIDHNVGSVSPVAAGTKSVSPTSDTTYTGTATGPGGTVTCTASVTVTTTTPPPTCTLSANPTAIQSGSSSTLSWTTTNASSFSINQGIGSVSPVAAGSKSVSPTATTTYTGTATGSGGSVTCKATITVSTTPPPTGCILVKKETFDPSGNELTPVAQFTFRLDGGSTTAINDATGLAEFKNVSLGTHTITEDNAGSSWKQISVTPAGGKVDVFANASCVAVVFKNQQVVGPQPPACTLAANPSSVLVGGTSALSWTTANATTFSINQGIGSVAPVAAGATSTLPINADTTFTGTATGAGGTAVCSAKVTITTTPPPLACTLSASPATVSSGGTSTLTWTTTSATSFVIDQGIGTTTPTSAGSTTTPAITGDTTFTGTASDSSGHTVTCTASVSTSGGGGGPTPACTLTASPATVNSGDTSTLSWTTANVTNFVIDQGIGTTTPVASGSTTTPAITNQVTFTGTGTGPYGTVTCQATISTGGGGGGGGCSGSCCSGGCGGGGGGPSILLSALPHVGTSTLAYLYLSQIPYTGLDLGPVGTVLYWLALIGWCLAAAYLILFGALPWLAKKGKEFGGEVLALVNAELPTPAVAVSAPVVAPITRAMIADAPPSSSRTEGRHSAYEGFKSFAREGALTIDDIVKGLSRMPAPEHKAAAPTTKQNAMPPAVNNVEPVYQNVEPIYENVEPIATGEHSAKQNVLAAEVPSFIAALLAGRREEVYATLRSLVQSGADAESFIAQVSLALDDAYRARVEGAPAHPEILAITKNLATPVLERLVSALSTAVDSTYSIGITGAKLAVTRALGILGA